MDTSDVTKIVPAAWVAQKVLGPTLNLVGKDLSKVYKKGTTLIFKKARRKIINLDDGKIANLRVTRDVFWNGSFNDNDVCAEYFAGALASSRTNDGRDDSAIFYLNKVQSLSSTQLHLHYLIYNRLNKLFIESGSLVNVALDSELRQNKLYISTLELEKEHNIPWDRDLVALFKTGLIEEYYTTVEILEGDKGLPYARVAPTTLGIQLYAMAHNKLVEWKEFSTLNFGEFDGINNIEFYKLSLNELIEAVK